MALTIWRQCCRVKSTKKHENAANTQALKKINEISYELQKKNHFLGWKKAHSEAGKIYRKKYKKK